MITSREVADRFGDRLRRRSLTGPLLARPPFEPPKAHPKTPEVVVGDVRSEAQSFRWGGAAVGPVDSLDRAFRLVHLVWCGGAPQEIGAFACFIARHQSRGSSEGNHRVGELAALAVAAYYLGTEHFDDLIDELPQVLSRQVHRDGWPVEQSTSYHLLNVQWALVALACTERLNLALTAWFSVQQNALVAIAGHGLLTIGDDDSSQLFGPKPKHIWAKEVVDCALSVVSGSTCAMSNQLAATLLMPRSGAFFVAPTNPRLFAAGGVVFLHNKSLSLWLDGGPPGRPPTFAHGHDDAGGLWVHFKGKPLLSNMGTYAYTQGLHSRAFFRSRVAMPCARISSTGQAGDLPFLWREVPNAGRVVSYKARSATVAVKSGENTLFREVSVTEEGAVVRDWFQGPRAQVMNISWPLQGTRVPQGITVACSHGAWKTNIGGSFPGSGWRCYQYGQKEPGLTLSKEVCLAPGEPVFTTLVAS